VFNGWQSGNTHLMIREDGVESSYLLVRVNTVDVGVWLADAASVQVTLGVTTVATSGIGTFTGTTTKYTVQPIGQQVSRPSQSWTWPFRFTSLASQINAYYMPASVDGSPGDVNPFDSYKTALGPTEWQGGWAWVITEPTEGSPPPVEKAAGVLVSKAGPLSGMNLTVSGWVKSAVASAVVWPTVAASRRTEGLNTWTHNATANQIVTPALAANVWHEFNQTTYGTVLPGDKLIPMMRAATTTYGLYQGEISWMVW